MTTQLLLLFVALSSLMSVLLIIELTIYLEKSFQDEIFLIMLISAANLFCEQMWDARDTRLLIQETQFDRGTRLLNLM